MLVQVDSQPAFFERIETWVEAKSNRWWLTATVLLAFVIRLVVACFAFHGIANPANAHGDFGYEMGWVARSLATGHGFSGPFQSMTGPTALVPPLYPFLLSGVFRVFGLYTPVAALVILVFNGALSALTCIPVFGAARDLGGPRLARWAAVLWALYPFAIFFSAAQVWDYPLTALLFAACFWYTARLPMARTALPWAGFGVLYGITALSNPSIVTLLPVLLIVALRRSLEIGLSAGRRSILTVLAFLIVITPWTIRNQRAVHVLSPLRDGFWLEFYAGNLGDPLNSNSPFAHPASNPAELALYSRLGEKTYLQQKHDLALEEVRQHKARFAVACARRAVRFWTGYWSLSPVYLQREPFDIPNIPFCSTLTLLALAGLVSGWRQNRAGLLPFLCLVALFPLPYYLTHASMDYRAPIEPELVILTTTGLLALRERLRATSFQEEEEPAYLAELPST